MFLIHELIKGIFVFFLVYNGQIRAILSVKNTGYSCKRIRVQLPRGLLVVQVMPRFLCSSSAVHLCLSLIGVSANRLTGGAMQLTFRKIAFDYYPFHWAG